MSLPSCQCVLGHPEKCKVLACTIENSEFGLADCRGCDLKIRVKGGGYCHACCTFNHCRQCGDELRDDRNEGYHDGSLCRDCEETIIVMFPKLLEAAQRALRIADFWVHDQVAAEIDDEDGNLSAHVQELKPIAETIKNAESIS